MANFFRSVSNIFRTKKDVYSTETGTQNYRLPGFPYLYDETPNDLSLNKELYDNVTVLESAIDIYQQLVNSGYNIKSDTESDVTLVDAILEELNMQEALDALLANTFIYGFSGSEVVMSSDLTRIIKIINVPSKDLRVKRNKEANVTTFYEINSMTGNKGNRFIELNPNRFLYFTRQETTDNVYGRSLFKALPFLTRIMLQMQDSIGKIYQKYGSPRFQVKYIPTVQLDQKTLNGRLNDIKDKFNDPKVGQDFFSAGDVDVSVIGSNNETLRFTIEMSEIMQGVFSGLKLPAGILGYNYGSTETHLGQQVEILLGRITSYQNHFASLINHSLMPMIAKVYNLSAIPIFEFKRPIIADELVEATTFSTQISNMENLMRLGLITPEYASNKLNLPKLTGGK